MASVLTDKAEEVLEHLWVALEEKREEVGSAALPDEAMTLLQREHLVQVRAQRVYLTESGRREAERCIRRHRLAERLLSDILDGGEDQIHAAGCKFEHGLHAGLEEKVCTMLGHPGHCPHGRPIPPGECCRRMEREPGQLIVPLAEAEAGEEAVIAYLRTDDTYDLRKLMSIGALPGTSVVVKQRFPSFLLRMGESEFAVDEQMARSIYVRRHGS